MVALAEPGSVFVPQPGVVVEGAAVRAAEQQFLSLGLPITLKVRRVIVSGDIVGDLGLEFEGKGGRRIGGRSVWHDGRCGSAWP